MLNRIAMQKSFQYLELFYNKILKINYAQDSFVVIKADDGELDKLPRLITFSQWVKDFINSPYFVPYGENRQKMEFVKYFDLDYLRKLDCPLVLEYRKLVDGELHDMELTLLNVGSERAYIFVRDNTKINKIT